jgi:argininosuccinate lyase
MKTKLWGGRYATQTDQEVEQYTASIMFDKELTEEDILGSMAHAKMLGKCQILSEKENELIQNGLKSIRFKILNQQVQLSIDDEDIHMNIERLLTQEIGEVAKKLHTARSRNDQVALDLHLYLRQKVISILKLLVDLEHTLLQLARDHKDTILPGYTHLQRAQPIRLAQYWLAYTGMFSRDVLRLKELFARINRSPLGAGALTGSSFPIDRNYVADELGFDGVYLNTLDAVSDRDFIVEFLQASSLIMMHLSRMSEELILWCSQEFNFIQFDEAYCTGSSMMPQKKNPDIVELSRGKTGRVYGALISVLTMLKGLPLAYNKDMQEDKEPLFDTVKTLTQTLKIFSPLLDTLQINHDVMSKASKEGHLNATILAEYLVKAGMTFRSAHGLVGKMVADCIRKKCQLEDLTIEELTQYSPLISSDIYEILAVENATYRTVSDAKINDEIAICEEECEVNRAWVLAKENILLSINKKYFD